MKALICLGNLEEQGLSDGFSGISSAMLPVANKPLVEYYIDFCCSVGIRSILIRTFPMGETISRLFAADHVSFWVAPPVWEGAQVS